MHSPFTAARPGAQDNTYDQHEVVLIKAISNAITQASVTAGPHPVLVLQLPAIVNALVGVLGTYLALLPSEDRSPAALGEIHDWLVTGVSATAANPQFRAFKEKLFFEDGDVKGHA